MYLGRWAAKIQTNASTAVGVRTVDVCGGKVFFCGLLFCVRGLKSGIR